MTAGGPNRNQGRKSNKEKGLSQPLVTKCFRVDEEVYLKAQQIHGKELNKLINAYLKKLTKKP